MTELHNQFKRTFEFNGQTHNIIRVKKGETQKKYSQRINETAPYGRDQNIISKLKTLKESGEITEKEYQERVKHTAYFNIELKEEETFEDYVKKIEEIKPFGINQGKERLVNLIPMKHDREHAWREEMEYRSDWGGLRRTGLGWKVNPTIFIAMVFFLPCLIFIPLLYLIYTGSIELFISQFILQGMIVSVYFILLLFFIKLISYGTLKLDELLKPYGKDHLSIKMLFKDELEYLKFSRDFFCKVMSYKWIYIGFIGFICYLIPSIMHVIDIESYRKSLLAPIPDWSIIFIFISNLGLALIIFLVCTFFIAVIYALFKIGNLGSDRSKLSITEYGKVISSLSSIVVQKQEEKAAKWKMEEKLSLSGKTYYEFQRGNRKIGEFLFNLASILIFMSVLAGILIWIADLFDLFPESLDTNIFIWSVATAIFGILSLLIFLLPQIQIHLFLKDFKFNLIDSFASLSSRLEYIYFETMIHPVNLSEIDKEWTRRKDLRDDIKLIKETMAEVQQYGTWSYDFPEVIKLIIVTLATVLPIVLAFIPV